MRPARAGGDRRSAGGRRYRAPVYPTAGRGAGEQHYQPGGKTALLRSGLPYPLALTLAFSAKESGFKACHPDVQAGVGFNDFTLAAIKEGNLRLRLSTVEYRLQWIQAGEYIITLCAP
ncbi:hypothetical protein KPZU09_31370 [Klebsiella pneumoniae]|uniref:4'-phosphopantetheinyl transferase domain-containing protein n=1 Tax=Klebsiella pneumoniae TaxID=573 RepID=A0A919I0D3_KLEPN|nr:hypothetical protein KPZU09_31370 [Klebsiella pneumoniae]